MSNKEFKPGDLIFLINRANEILLAKFESYYGHNSVEAIDVISNIKYWGFGYATTPENRQALVTLSGEDAVPKLPLRGSELTRKLLEKQKYVLCRVSDYSDERAREWPQEICVVFAVDAGGFTLVDGGFTKFAVPIDEHGYEITEIKE